LEINYLPGHENVVPDAFLGWAYLKSSARLDVSLHGRFEACKEVYNIMLKEAKEIKDTDLFRISRRQGMKIRTESIINCITRSQKPLNPKPTVTVPFNPSPSSKPGGKNPVTTLASQTVPFRGFQFTPVGTLKPKAKPVVPHGEGVLNKNCDGHYRYPVSSSEVWEAFTHPWS